MLVLNNTHAYMTSREENWQASKQASDLQAKLSKLERS